MSSPLQRKSSGARYIHPKDISAKEIANSLKEFKGEILRVSPSAIVSFLTIPPASFKDFNMDEDSANEKFQMQHNALIEEVNSAINKVGHAGVSPFTVDWASDVMKKHKKRVGRRRTLKTVTRYNFSLLYDGLHGNSDTKCKWFSELVKGFRWDARTAREKEGY